MNEKNSELKRTASAVTEQNLTEDEEEIEENADVRTMTDSQVITISISKKCKWDATDSQSLSLSEKASKSKCVNSRKADPSTHNKYEVIEKSADNLFLFSAEVLKRLTAKLSEKMSETLKFKIAEFRESEKAVEAEKFISEALLKKKRVQKTLKEQKKALSDFDRNVLMNQCLSDIELTSLSKQKFCIIKYKTASYCFNWWGLWYKKYWRLTDLKDQAETAILNDTDLTKIIDNVDWWKTQRELSEFFEDKKTQTRKIKQTNDIHTTINDQFEKALTSEDERKISSAVKEKLLHYMTKIDKNLISETKTVNSRKLWMSKKRKNVIETVKRSIARWVTAIKLEDQMMNLFNAVNKAIVDKNISLREQMFDVSTKLEKQSLKYQSLQTRFCLLISRVIKVSTTYILMNTDKKSTITVNLYNTVINSEADQHLMSDALRSSDVAQNEFWSSISSLHLDSDSDKKSVFISWQNDRSLIDCIITIRDLIVCSTECLCISL